MDPKENEPILKINFEINENEQFHIEINSLNSLDQQLESFFDTFRLKNSLQQKIKTKVFQILGNMLKNKINLTQNKLQIILGKLKGRTKKTRSLEFNSNRFISLNSIKSILKINQTLLNQKTDLNNFIQYNKDYRKDNNTENYFNSKNKNTLQFKKKNPPNLFNLTHTFHQKIDNKKLVAKNKNNLNFLMNKKPNFYKTFSKYLKKADLSEAGMFGRIINKNNNYSSSFKFNIHKELGNLNKKTIKTFAKEVFFRTLDLNKRTIEKKLTIKNYGNDDIKSNYKKIKLNKKYEKDKNYLKITQNNLQLNNTTKNPEIKVFIQKEKKRDSRDNNYYKKRSIFSKNAKLYNKADGIQLNKKTEINLNSTNSVMAEEGFDLKMIFQKLDKNNYGFLNISNLNLTILKSKELSILKDVIVNIYKNQYTFYNFVEFKELCSRYIK